MPIQQIPYGVLDGRYVNSTGDNMLGALYYNSNLSIWHDTAKGIIDSSHIAPTDIQIITGAQKMIYLENEVYDDIRIVPGGFHLCRSLRSGIR
jgi:hypothetical protein